MKKLLGKWSVCYPVASVAGLTHDQALTFLVGRKGKDYQDAWFGYEPKELSVTIDYPLNQDVTFKVKPKLDCMKQPYVSLGLLLRDVARKYKEIYRKPAKYGIWGHGIGDLVFESVRVDDAGRVTLGIGS